MRRHHREEGFTLIELAIVCVVIGILASIAIPNYSRTKAHSTRASCISNQRNLWAAATLYAAEHGVTDAVLTSDDLLQAHEVPSGLTDCPETQTTSHDNYVITLEGGKVTVIRCLANPVEHLWSP